MMTSTATKDRAPAVHSIGGFSLVVPDLDEAFAFYDAFGLQVRRTARGLALATCDGRRWGTVVAGARKRLGHIAFDCHETDLAPLRERLARHGMAPMAAPDWVEDADGIWFRDPDGLLLQVRVGPKTTLDAARRVALPTPVDGVRGAANRGDRQRVRPGRLSHIMRFTTDVSRAVGFYGDVLGLRLSDRAGDLVAFMHGPHGSDHHLMAFARSDRAGLHHFSWDVPTVEEVGLGAMQMSARGYTKGWGVGRHVLGSNYFHYVADPWGSFSEYSAGMDFIPASMRWDARDHPPEDASYLWGPAIPDYMHENAERD